MAVEARSPRASAVGSSQEGVMGAAVTSAATREALKHSEGCMLFVSSGNLSAIRLYEKLGYKKVGEELWIDIGTGLVP